MLLAGQWVWGALLSAALALAASSDPAASAQTRLVGSEAELWEEECGGLDGRDPPPHCADQLNVGLSGAHEECVRRAEELAARHDLVLVEEVKGMPCHFTFAHPPHRGHVRSRRSASARLSEDPEVDWAAADVVKRRPKRGGVQSPVPPTLPFRDPNYNDQWYLHNGAVGGYDMWVKGAWAAGYSGVNVSVSILDDGIQPDHPDLAKNYDPKASYDVNDRDEDPTPRDNNDNKHGTRCAGEVAAEAGNEWCGVGVAYNGLIGGVRMLDGPVSDRVEAASLHHNQDHIDVYSASWGPEDDGRTFDGPGPLAKRAFRDGISSGRGGLGNIFIWASGNGGAHADSCSCDGYTTSIYTLSVSSATFDNRKPWYLEECPSTIASTYSSAGAGQPAIVTTDMPNACTKYHTGTSASAPMAAGIVALALEANRRLTWRDMQHLVLRTADPSALLSNAGWSINGVGRKISNKFGYGIMNAEALVKAAAVWTSVPEQRNCSLEFQLPNNKPVPLEKNFNVTLSLDVSGCEDVRYLEQLQAVITVRISRRGDLRLTLISPMGTRSVLLPKRPGDANRSGFHKWPFLSVQQWGEDPRGTWRLIVENAGFVRTSGTLLDWSLLLYGTESPAQAGDPTHGPGTGTAAAAAGATSAPWWPTEEEDKVVGFFRRAAGEAEPPDGTADSSPASPPPPSSPSTTNTAAPPHKPSGDSHPTGQLSFSGCHAECEQSGGCERPDDASACAKCAHLRQRKLNRAGILCVSHCAKGWWLESSAGSCRQCMKGCEECSSAEVCSRCDPHLFLVRADLDSFHHGTCVDQCPPGFQLYSADRSCRLDCPIKDCGVCASPTTCGECRADLFLASAKTSCVPACASTEFVDAARACTPCPSMCEACRDGKSCDRCTQGTHWDGGKNFCSLAKGADALACPSPCRPAGEFCDRSRWQCARCHSSCATCVGPTATACLSCPDGSAPDAGRCGPSAHACPQGQFFDTKLGECETCHASCAECEGHGPGQCTACQRGKAELRAGVCRLCCEPARTIARSTEAAAAVIGPRDCVTCARTAVPVLLSASQAASQWGSLAVLAVVAAVGAFAALFLCLLCRERRPYAAYKPLPDFVDRPRGSADEEDEDDFIFTRTPHR